MNAFRKIIQNLTAPSPAVTNSLERTNAQLLSTLLFLRGLVFLGIVIEIFWGQAFSVLPGVMLAMLINSVAYTISRTKHYKWGAGMIITESLILIPVMVITLADRDTAIQTCIWLGAGPLISGLTLPVRQTIYYSIATLISFVIILLNVQDSYQHVLAGVFLFTVATNIFILIGTYLRNESERKLVSSEKSFRAIFESNPVGISIINSNLEYVSLNRAFLEFMGYTEAEMAGKTIADFTHPDDVETAVSKASRLLHSGEFLKRYEKRYIHKDGSTIWGLISSRSVILDESGKPYLFTMIEDITSIKEREIELQATQAKMIASSRMAEIGQMAGGIAHEINNPLAIIQGKADQLNRILQATDVPITRRQDAIAKILQNTERIAKIIRSLRTISRNSEKDPLAPECVKTIIEETLELCSERIRQNSVQIRTDIDQNLQILCRQSQIGQVLLNLISNSFDAVLDLQDRWIEISAKRKSDRIVISVTDSGLGIPEDVVEKMMAPFYTTKPVGKGTGLGLSISRGIIEDHGGSINYNPKGQNTSFKIELPLPPLELEAVHAS